MKSINYGTQGYYEKELKVKNLAYELLSEAVKMRMDSGKLQCSDFGLYAQVLREAEIKLEEAATELEEATLQQKNKTVAEDNANE